MQVWLGADQSTWLAELNPVWRSRAVKGHHPLSYVRERLPNFSFLSRWKKSPFSTAPELNCDWCFTAYTVGFMDVGQSDNIFNSYEEKLSLWEVKGCLFCFPHHPSLLLGS